MSTTGSESDFDEISFSDCEWGNAGGATGDDSSTVLVELPPELHDSISSARSNTSDQSSVASSFVPVQQMRGLTLHSKGNLKSDDSADKDSWSHLGSVTRNTDASLMGHEVRSLSPSWATNTTATVASSSIISGFDVLSLNGSSHRQCRRCTFLNNKENTLCFVCDNALVANPCLDVDQQIALNLQRKEEQDVFCWAGDVALVEKRCLEIDQQNAINRQRKEEEGAFCLPFDVASVANPCLDTDQKMALNLQRQEEEDAFETLRCEEKKRKTLHQLSLLEQASVLATDVQTRIDTIKCHGVSTFSILDLTFHASHFIENWHRQNAQARQRPTVHVWSPGLHTIPNHVFANKLGWIVATIEEGERAWKQSSLKTIPVSSCTGQITTSDFASTYFPLVSFDTCLRRTDVIRRLENGLTQVCQDFLDQLDGVDWAPDNYNTDSNQSAYAQSCEPSPTKKPRAQFEFQGFCKEEEDDNIKEEESREDDETIFGERLEDDDSCENLAAEVFDSSETIFGENVTSLGGGVITTPASVVISSSSSSNANDGATAGGTTAVDAFEVSVENLSTTTSTATTGSICVYDIGPDGKWRQMKPM